VPYSEELTSRSSGFAYCLLVTRPPLAAVVQRLERSGFTRRVQEADSVGPLEGLVRDVVSLCTLSPEPISRPTGAFS
jgi:hypothetical protein